MTQLLQAAEEHTIGERLKANVEPLRNLLLNTADSTKEERMIEVFMEAWSMSWKKAGMSPILPLLFQLKGQPYNILDKHFPMTPMFRLFNMPRKTIIKGGRQFSKSTTLAYQGTAHSLIQRYFNTLFVTPLYEQIRRFSQNYVKQAINTCRMSSLVKERGKSENVLQRGFPNGSSMFFSFAFRDCERTRGINADKVAYDEVQGLDKTFIPVIRESMSASPFRFEQYSGTPLTMDNTIQFLWEQSSMAEWLIPCDHCGYSNIAADRYDLMKMIGKWDPAAGTGLQCAKCKKPIYTRRGHWWHEKPQYRFEFAGYHAPQIIFPMHCEEDERWHELLKKMANQDQFTFMTECLGESFDAGAKLVTLSQIRDACTLPWPNDIHKFKRKVRLNSYIRRVLAIDWSGGGADEESLTAVAALGLTNEGQVHVLWGKKYHHSNDYAETAQMIMKLYQEFGCHKLVHDFGGAGIGREQILVQLGFPMDYIVPVTYVRQSGERAMMNFVPPINNNVRASWSLNKARSLIFCCELIKQGILRFPKWESIEPECRDFLALVEETTQTPRGSDIFLIGKAQGVPDDFAHAVNIGTCALFNEVGRWPDLSKNLKTPSGQDATLSKKLKAEIDPDKPDWN